jgi:hypothetical protein
MEHHFPALFKLYRIISARSTPPTPFEVLIATNSKDIDEVEVKDYLQSLEVHAQPTIQSAFDQQTAVCMRDSFVNYS